MCAAILPADALPNETREDYWVRKVREGVTPENKEDDKKKARYRIVPAPGGMYCFQYDKSSADGRKAAWKLFWWIILGTLAILHEYWPNGHIYPVLILALGALGMAADTYFDNYAECFVDGYRAWYIARMLGYLPNRRCFDREQLTDQTRFAVDRVSSEAFTSKGCLKCLTRGWLYEGFYDGAITVPGRATNL
jgi:hypothetical protein